MKHKQKVKSSRVYISLHLQHLKNVKLGYFVKTFHSIIDSVDKRGRLIKKSSKEDLEKFYDIHEDRDDQPTPETGMNVIAITNLHGIIFLLIEGASSLNFR